MSSVGKEEARRWCELFKELGIDIEAGLKVMDKVEFVKQPVQRSDPAFLGQKINEMRDLLDEVEKGEVFGDGSLKSLYKAVGFEPTRSDNIRVRGVFKEDERITFQEKKPEQLIKALPAVKPANPAPPAGDDDEL